MYYTYYIICSYYIHFIYNIFIYTHHIACIIYIYVVTVLYIYIYIYIYIVYIHIYIYMQYVTSPGYTYIH